MKGHCCLFGLHELHSNALAHQCRADNHMDATSASALLLSCMQLHELPPDRVLSMVMRAVAPSTSLQDVVAEAGLSDVKPTHDAVEDYIRELRLGSDASLSTPCVLLIGPSNAGKSTLLKRWVTNEFIEQLDPTQGFQLCTYPPNTSSGFVLPCLTCLSPVSSPTPSVRIFSSPSFPPSYGPGGSPRVHALPWHVLLAICRVPAVLAVPRPSRGVQ